MHQSGPHHIGWRESSSSRLSPFSSCSRRDVLPFLAAKENLTIKEFGSVGNAKCRWPRRWDSANSVVAMFQARWTFLQGRRALRLETCCCAKQSGEFADASAVKRCKRWKAGRPDSSSGYEFVVGVSAG